MSERRTQCKRGHAVVDPAATYEDGTCKRCKALYNANYQPGPPPPAATHARTFRQLQAMTAEMPTVDRLDVALRFWLETARSAEAAARSGEAVRQA